MTNKKGLIARTVEFLMHGIWRMRSDKLPRYKGMGVNFLRVLVLSVRGFDEDKCSIRASALTYYCILAIVPVLAMAFGISRGFGFDDMLRGQILTAFEGQKEVGDWLIKFANAFLENVKGGIVAGLGVAILLWTVISVLHQIESAMNAIWAIYRSRTWMRKFADYLSFMLICPILFVLASGLTIYGNARLDTLSQDAAIVRGVEPLIRVLLATVPFLLIWLLFVVTYIFMPNTKVRFRPALVAGITAGTLFQLMQWSYIKLQFLLAGYSAVYGSFAALPLFLIWLQLSWMIVLFGAELAFSMQNVKTYEFEPDYLQASRSFRRLVALAVVHLAVNRFTSKKVALSSEELSSVLEVPIKLVRQTLDDLVTTGILTEVITTQREGQMYQPAVSCDFLTIGYVSDTLDDNGRELPINESPAIAKIKGSLAKLRDTLKNSPDNLLLRDIELE